jgi:hypothetical protein
VSDEIRRDGVEAPKGALRRTLDVCLFAPVGMAVTLAEDLPEFVAKGRQRVGVQLGNAKVVGRFVVTHGGRRVADRVEGVWHGISDEENTSEEDDVVVVPEPSRTVQPPPDPAATAIVEGALADYDTLSASQVVRRLESLGPDELHAVQSYEASHRNRRTILNRAGQLLDEGPAAAAAE